MRRGLAVKLFPLKAQAVAKADHAVVDHAAVGSCRNRMGYTRVAMTSSAFHHTGASRSRAHSSDATGEGGLTDRGAADVTTLLERWSQGDSEAFDRLMPLVYDQLRRLAARSMVGERPGHTLQPTALVHEAYLELANQNRAAWTGRAQFFGVAAQLMRRITLVHARRLRAQKRGGDWAKIPFEESLGMTESQAEEILAIDRALTALAEEDERLCRVVEARFFVGMTVDETAEALDVSPSTVKREWRLARAWLHDRLARAPARDSTAADA